MNLTKKGTIQLDKRAIQQAAHTDGKWVIETNDDTLTPQDAASAYKALAVIEQCFRKLKTTQLELEPVYHRLTRRIQAHVKICVLALLIERMVELACDQSWSWIYHELGKLQATEFESESHHFFRRNEPSVVIRQLFKKLDIPLPNSVLGIIPLPASPSES